MFYRQHYHILGLIVLLLIMRIATRIPGMVDGQLWNVRTDTWFMITVVIVILHQFYIWFCWRSQLHFQTLTDYLGTSAFPVYSTMAVLFLIARPVFVVITGMANQQSLEWPGWICWTLTGLLSMFFFWTVYTLVRHFSLIRILGGDHFYRDLRQKGLVKKGLFRYIPHPMYTLGMLGMWIPGLIFRSQAALILALFQHLYIWVHYYTLEQPDMNVLYGEQDETKHPAS